MDKENKNPNVPNLRFNYAGNWTINTLDEICDFYKGNGLSKSDLSSEGRPCILYGELYTSYKKEIIDSIISKTDTMLSKPFISKKNDVIIPGSGEDPIDIAVARAIENDGIILGGDLNVLRLHPKYSGAFLSYQLNGKRRYEIAKKAQGKSIVHLHNSDLKDIKVFMPQYDEQLKIINLLKHIDKRIELQNKIIEDYETLRNTINLQVIGKKDPNTKISECLDCFSSSKKESDILVSPEGDFPAFGANGLIRRIDKYDYQTSGISIVKDGAGVGKMYYLTGKYSIVGTQNLLQSKNGYNLVYLYYALQNFDFRKYIVGSGIPHIYFKDYKNESIYIPESKKMISTISKCLASIDTKITIEKGILNRLLKQKEYLLQNLFI